jgi:hypothetical protein
MSLDGRAEGTGVLTGGIVSVVTVLVLGAIGLGWWRSRVAYYERQRGLLRSFKGRSRSQITVVGAGGGDGIELRGAVLQAAREAGVLTSNGESMASISSANTDLAAVGGKDGAPLLQTAAKVVKIGQDRVAETQKRAAAASNGAAKPGKRQSHGQSRTSKAALLPSTEEWASESTLSTETPPLLSPTASAPTLGSAGTLRSTRFTSDMKELVMGQPSDAALGIAHYMNVAPEEMRAGMSRGVAQIETEFERFAEAARGRPAGDDTACPWWATTALADTALECMQYVLHGRAGSSTRLFDNSPHPRDCNEDGVLPERRTASGEGMRLADFCALDDAVTANLDAAHVAALRIYSTAAYQVLNGPLREQGRTTAHPMPVTMAFLSEAIGRLRAVGARVSQSNNVVDLWRGMRGMRVATDFARHGGTELAPMSTTTELKVALLYSQCLEGSLLFKLRTNSFMARGASITFLSAFPTEEEVLFPPLTYLQPTRKQEEIKLSPTRTVLVVEVVPHLGSC